MPGDLDAFFAEQDAIAALPEEDVGQYLDRISKQPPRRMKWSALPHLTSRALDERETPGPTLPVIDAVPSISGEYKEHSDRRGSMERSLSFRPDSANGKGLAPVLPEDGPGSTPENHDSIYGDESLLQMDRLPFTQRAASSSSNETGAGGLSHSREQPSSPQAEKRKQDFPSGPTPSKRRALSSDASAGASREPSEPHSPILSFSKVGRKGKASKPVVLDQGPQLDLVPLVEDNVERPSRQETLKVRSSSHKRQASGSDAGGPVLDSDQPKMKRRAIQSEPSGLFEEMKGRVTRHAGPKSRPKTVQLAKTDPVSTGTAMTMDESDIICLSSSSPPRPISPGAAPAKQRKRLEVPLEKGKPRQTNVKSSTKGKKEKPKLLSPFEYAEDLISGGQGGAPKTHRKASGPPFLAGYNVFYTGGDRTYASETTRNRMDILVRHGANLIPRFDPNVVTHIISEGSRAATANALGLKRLADIPRHIPTLRWTWVTMGMKYANHLPKNDMDARLQKYLLDHAAFSDRLDAGEDAGPIGASKKGKEKEKPVDEDMSIISDFTQDNVYGPTAGTSKELERVKKRSSPEPPSMLPSPSTSPTRGPDHGGSSSRITLNQDPLAEFYEQAKVQKAQDEGFLSAPSSDAEDVPSPVDSKPRKSSWLCDNKEALVTNCPNQDIIDKLSELMELHKAKLGQDDNWRAFAYSKAIRALRSHSTRIRSYEEAKTIKGVGEKTARKIAEILETGDLRRISYERTEDVEVAKLFQGIYGVGRTTAYQWYSAGCRTLDDLRNGRYGVKLSSAQETGLKYYDDINDRMPRSEAEAIYKLIEPIALSIEPKLFIRIMGSFRRGKATCGDIDILITRPTDDGKTHSGVLPRLFEALHTAGILTDDLALPDDPYDLEATYRGLCRIPTDPKSKRRRIDILSVPWKARGGALLYYTGDDIFNRAMRFKANKMGYSLNQRGLYAGVVRDPKDRRNKVVDGHVVASETEEEIFRILGVPWQEPHERVRG